MLSLYVLIASIILCLIIVGLVVSRGLKDTKTILYGLLTISMLTMIVSNYMSFDTLSNQLFYVRGVMFSATLSGYLSYLLIYNLKKDKKHKKFYKNPFFYITILVAILDWTSFLFLDVKSGSPPQPIYGPGIFIFFIHFIMSIILAIHYLRKYIKVARTKNEKRKYLPLLFGFIPAMIFSPITGFILPMLGVSDLIILTPIYVVIFVIFVGYAIIKHGLFDIKQAVIRTSAYILSLLSLSAIYYVVAYLLSIYLFKNNVSSSLSVSPINIALALLLAFVFQPIKSFFDKITDNIFYKDKYNTDDFFAKLNKTLSYSTDLRGLLERVSIDISQTLKSEQAFFFINTDNGHFVSAGTAGHRQLPKEDAVDLDLNIKNINSVIVSSLLDDEDVIKRIMISHRIELILPLSQNEKIIGYFCLGEHKASNYTNRDIKVLNTISSELIIAIQNALAVQEIREFNLTLQQRIANATVELRASNRMLRQLDKAKDEFVGMASHQLRTPLTSVKGYISMVLDGDAGKITGNQRQLLNEAFSSSERMVNLINDFLNVSRIQTGKFLIEKKPINMAKLIDQEVENLRSTADAHNLKFIYNKPTDFPNINIDESKIKQVVMNFLDNSIYYSKDNTSVDVILTIKGDNVIFKVKDNGIGVPKSEMSRLFTKFYRATNARTKRPDGTGVGIYLAKKIIDEHGGRIIFESTEGIGSTFGFSLPIK